MKATTPLFLVSVLFLSACASVRTLPPAPDAPPPAAPSANDQALAPAAPTDDAEEADELIEDSDDDDNNNDDNNDNDNDDNNDFEEEDAVIPKVLDGPAMPADLQSFVAKKFPVWVREWKASVPSFDLTQFVKGEDELLGAPYAFSLPKDEARDLFFTASPNDKEFAGVTGADVTNDEDDRSIIFDVDSSIVTIDAATDQAKQWETLGPCCGFYDVAWLDDSTLVVAASMEDSIELFDTESRCPEDEVCKESRILLFHLDAGTKEVYRGPLMTEDEHDSWWERFWEGRFPGFEIF